MRINYIYFTLVFVSMQLNVFAQKLSTRNNYTELVREANGDLNKDGKPDKVIVMMDIISPTRPLRLQVFLTQPNGKLKLVVASEKAIEPMYPAGNTKPNGFQIPSFIIENGILNMWSEIKGGNISYDFKYQKGNFELIKVSKIVNNAKVAIDEKTIFTETEFNLITGLRTEIDQRLGSEKIINQRKTTVKIRPLPQLQNFKFTDKNLH